MKNPSKSRLKKKASFWIRPCYLGGGTRHYITTYEMKKGMEELEEKKRSRLRTYFLRANLSESSHVKEKQ